MHKITSVIPTHNNLPFLKLTVKSVKKNCYYNDMPIFIFAENCIERFLNPYLNHHLQAIAFEHDTKVKVRLVPTYNAYIEKFGHAPPLLHEIMGDCATETGN